MLLEGRDTIAGARAPSVNSLAPAITLQLVVCIPELVGFLQLVEFLVEFLQLVGFLQLVDFLVEFLVEFPQLVGSLQLVEFLWFR